MFLEVRIAVTSGEGCYYNWEEEREPSYALQMFCISISVMAACMYTYVKMLYSKMSELHVLPSAIAQ